MPSTSKPKRQTPRIPGGLNPGVLQDNISYLTRVVRIVIQQATPEHLGDFELIGGQLTALALIAANDGVSQNDLARAMLMKKSLVTSLLLDLVMRCFVGRSASSADRRFNALSLTPQCATLWKKASDGMVQHSDTVLSSLTSVERKELRRLLQKLIATHLDAQEAALIEKPT